MSQYAFLFGICCLPLILVGIVPAQSPTDNPVATFYNGPAGYPAWTDQIHWSNVIDMSSYDKGKTHFQKFENARDELAAKGGGVLYYPAGEYDFSDGPFEGPEGRGLMLKSGVVIRGQAPGADRNASDGTMDLPTKFKFGFKERAGGQVPHDWNLVGLMPEKGKRISDVKNVGICWVELDGGTIWFGPDRTWGDTVASAGAWKSGYAKARWKDRKPDGSHPTDPFLGGVWGNKGGKFVPGASGRLVFGNKLIRAAVTNDMHTGGRYTSSQNKGSKKGFGEDGIHMEKFGPRIGVYGSRVFVANNLLPMSPTGNFKYEQTTQMTKPGRGNQVNWLGQRKSTVFWDYGRTMGIDVNKDMIGGVDEGGKSAGFFQEGVVVKDNYVWNHGHKGFNIAGKWVTVANNHNERHFLRGGKDPYGIGGWRLTLDGFIESAPGGGGQISDNLSRAFDLAGQHLWISKNFYNNLGSAPGNDGEGILCQLHGGTHLYSWAATRNRHEVGGHHKSYIGGFNVDTLGLLVAWNQTQGWCGTLLRSCKGADIAVVANPQSPTQTGKHPTAVTEDPAGELTPPQQVKAEVYQGDAVKITWQDVTDAEIGYRVDRKIDNGQWQTIAYRPPQIDKSDMNPPAWIDFLAPTGKSLVYRVVAINSKDTDQGASAPTPALRLVKP